MEAVRQRVKSYVSTWLLILFALALAGLLAFSELFHNVVADQQDMDAIANPIRADILANLDELRLKNRLGKFTLSQQEDGDWMLVEPRRMPAPAQTIASILQTLESISIYTLHEKEPLNLQSFSLDSPTVTLDLRTKLDERVQINIGLVNPVNNTLYMTVSNHDVIFQTSSLPSKLEQLKLSDFIDSHIFRQNLDEIKEFRLYRGKGRQSAHRLTRDAEGWKSDRFQNIKNSSVDSALAKILAIRSHTIVDSQDEKLNTLLENYLKNPLYRIEIETLDGKKSEYTVSGLLGAVADLKIEKRQYVLVRSSETSYPHLIHKDHLEDLNIRYQSLR